MSKIVPLLLVLFVGEILMRHSTDIHLNFVLFFGILAFCFVFWRFVLALVSLIFKLIATIFFLRLFR
ncbi:hypothetical protein ACIL4E_002386 [Enterococcus hirae]